MSVFTKASPRRRTDEIHFRVIYLSTLPVFVVAALVARLLPGRAARLAARLGDAWIRPSILREARASAQACGSCALMG